jgi:hypothetical protein
MSRFKILRRVMRVLGIIFIFLVGNVSLGFADVDIYIEPWGAPPYETPDIWADNDFDGIQECEEPKLGEDENYLVARIHNIGTTDAPTGTVSVKFLYAPYGLGYPHTDFKQIGVTLQNPSSIAGGGGYLDISTQWDLSDLTENNGGLWPYPISSFNHFCVRVEIECAADVDLTNNEAQNNFTAVPCSECGFNFMIVNPSEEQASASLITSELKEGWRMSITARGIKNIQEFTLAPNERKLARLKLSHPNGQDEMCRDIDVSLKLDGKLAGGITFRTVKSPARKFNSLSFHVGGAIPIGNYSKTYNSGYSFITDIDFHFSSQFSLVLLFGYNRFLAGELSVNDTHWWNLSANLKGKISVSHNINLYLNAGAGAYITEGKSVRTGVNAGLGWNYSLSPDCRLEFGSDYHYVFKSSNVQFIVTHVGVVFRY